MSAYCIRLLFPESDANVQRGPQFPGTDRAGPESSPAGWRLEIRQGSGQDEQHPPIEFSSRGDAEEQARRIASTDPGARLHIVGPDGERYRIVF